MATTQRFAKFLSHAHARRTGLAAATAAATALRVASLIQPSRIPCVPLHLQGTRGFIIAQQVLVAGNEHGCHHTLVEVECHGQHVQNSKERTL